MGKQTSTKEYGECCDSKNKRVCSELRETGEAFQKKKYINRNSKDDGTGEAKRIKWSE